MNIKGIMKTVDKEKELNDYIREWIDARYYDWSTFYHDVQINKRSGIYQLKKGGELFDYLSNIVANIEEHLIAGKSCHIIPSKFSSIDQFLCFVRNFKQYISDNYHLLEINIAGEDTSYMVITMCEIIDAVNDMAERCLDIYLREAHTPEPYSLMRRSLAKDRYLHDDVGRCCKRYPIRNKKNSIQRSIFSHYSTCNNVCVRI